MRRRSSRPSIPALLRARVVGTALAWLVVGPVLVGCAPTPDDGAGPREWRDLDLVVPAGWTVLDQRSDLLLIANEDIRVDDLDADPSPPADPDSNDVVAVQMIADPAATPDAWRELVDSEDGTIEQDEQVTIGALPATSIVYRWESGDVPSRERVVFVPSRELYILLQPVPLESQTTGPEVYDRHTDEFQAVLDSIEFGRPFEEE